MKPLTSIEFEVGADVYMPVDQGYAEYVPEPWVCTWCSGVINPADVAWVRLGDDRGFVCYNCAKPYVVMSTLA